MQVSGFLKIFYMLFKALFPSCILVPSCAIGLFLFFEKMNIGARRVINIISSTTFGVYLLHDSNFIRTFLWCKIVRVQALYQSQFFPLYGIMICSLIFVFCSLFDLLRLKFVEPCAIRLVDKLTEKFKDKFEGDL